MIKSCVDKYLKLQLDWRTIYGDVGTSTWVHASYYVGFEVVSHCNHRCMWCSHFSPFSNPEFISVDKFEQDLKQAIRFFKGGLKAISILGGEPLLHPQIEGILRIARKVCGDGILVGLITNAELVPVKGERFVALCVSLGVILQCSLYDFNGVAVEVARKWYRKFGGGFLPVFYSKGRWYGRSVGVTDVIKSRSCFVGGCVFISNGNLCPCSFAFYVLKLNGVMGKEIFSLFREDYVNIYEQDLNDYITLLSRPSLTFCKQCGDGHSVKWREAFSKEDYINGWLGNDSRTEC